MVANFLTKNIHKEKHMYCMHIIYCPSNIDMKSEVPNKIHDNKSYLMCIKT